MFVVRDPIADTNRHIQKQLTKQIQEAAFPEPKPVLIVIGAQRGETK